MVTRHHSADGNLGVSSEEKKQAANEGVRGREIARTHGLFKHGAEADRLIEEWANSLEDGIGGRRQEGSHACLLLPIPNTLPCQSGGHRIVGSYTYRCQPLRDAENAVGNPMSRCQWLAQLKFCIAALAALREVSAKTSHARAHKHAWWGRDRHMWAQNCLFRLVGCLCRRASRETTGDPPRDVHRSDCHTNHDGERHYWAGSTPTRSTLTHHWICGLATYVHTTHRSKIYTVDQGPGRVQPIWGDG